MSGIARILLDRGGLVSGSDAKESRGLHALRARGALIRIGHDPSSLDLLPGGADRGHHHPRRHPEDQPRAGRGPAARHSGDPAPGGAGQADGRAHHADGHRHPRQDHDDVDADRGPAALRPRPVVRGGRGSRGGRHQRPPRQRRLLCRRGRRKRRLAARVHAQRRGGHQHRDRSPGLLTAAPTPTSRSSTAFVERLAPGWGAGGLHRRPRGGRAGPAQQPNWVFGCCDTGPRSQGEPDPAGRPLLSWEQQGTGAVAHIQLAGRSPHAARDAAVGARTAHGAQRAGRAAGGDRGRRRRPTRCSTGWPVSRACVAASNWSDTVAVGAGVRRLRPPSDRDQRRRCRRSARSLEQGGEGRVASWCSSPIYIRGQRLSRPISVAPWTPPTRFSCSTCTAAREQPIAGVSGASVAEHVSVPVRYLPGFLCGRRAGGRGRRPRRRHRHDGRRRRDLAGAGDRDRAAGAGQPQRARPARGVAMTEPNDTTPTDLVADRAEPQRTSSPPSTLPIARSPNRSQSTKPNRKRPIRGRASRIRGAASAGPPGTGRAPRRAGPGHRDRGSAPRSQAPGRRAPRQRAQTRCARRGSRLEDAARRRVMLVIVGVGLALILYFTPVMSARNIVVTGTRRGDAAKRSWTPPRVRAGHTAAADQHQPGRRPGRGDPPGGQRPGAASVSVGPADHDRRASSRGGQGLSGRPAPLRPRRRRLRDRAAASGAALHRCRQPRAERPDDQGRAAGADWRCAPRSPVRSAGSRPRRWPRSPSPWAMGEW